MSAQVLFVTVTALTDHTANKLQSNFISASVSDHSSFSYVYDKFIIKFQDGDKYLIIVGLYFIDYSVSLWALDTHEY